MNEQDQAAKDAKLGELLRRYNEAVQELRELRRRKQSVNEEIGRLANYLLSGYEGRRYQVALDPAEPSTIVITPPEGAHKEDPMGQRSPLPFKVRVPTAAELVHLYQMAEEVNATAVHLNKSFPDGMSFPAHS